VFDVGFVGTILPTDRAREAILVEANRRFGMNDWRRFHTVEEMAQVYAHSRFVIDPPIWGDVNMRFFEAMAAGAVVVSPLLGNGLSELASAGQHFLGADFSEAGSPARAVADAIGTKSAVDIACAGRQLIRDRHTYHHRVREVLEVMRAAEPLAPIRSMTAKGRSEAMVAVAAAIVEQRLALASTRSASKQLVRQLVETTARSSKRRVIRLARRIG
jgi:glycosyltransferase involved in cell wall biosynthesis